MSLRSKVVLILLCMFLLYGIVDLIVYRFLIFPSFITLEQDEIRKDSERCIFAVKREIHYIDSLCHDWAAWDDTYDFIESQSPDYIAANLQKSTFIDNHINLLYYFDNKGKIIWGKTYDLETREFILLPDFSKNSLPESHPLISYNIGNTPFSEIKTSGIFLTAKGPVIVSSRPILKSSNQGL
ncbi:Chase 4 domain-containing protein [Desulfonema limicola]|uniref:Chase 4 domain-containing protein n=1 Tax=Desulfonema limicola TaxID=45656 RepID=A0A975BDE3_9BACT|nr:CHASE4 domain-containing protein [Desulfonema limicola]QTA83210.1 Chase 4 domain-containing protein [Desulfonema limicola]